MNASILLKSILAKMLTLSGAVERKIKKKYVGKFLILMYHRVVRYNKVGSGLQAGMYVDPETFSMHIHYLKKYFNVIPLYEMYASFSNKIEKRSNIPICVLTFDDGWHDFYEFAYPIISKQKLPATVFLPTKYINTGDRFWTDQVANLYVQKENINKILYNYQYSNNDAVKVLNGLEGRIESKIERAISFLKNYSDDEISNILVELKTTWGMDSISKERTFLNWGEVREMAKSGLIKFGSHTDNHKMLTHLNKGDIIEELNQSK